MIIPDLKKAYSTTMAKRRSPAGEDMTAAAPMKQEVSKDESGETDPRHAAAQDMMSAMHEKSPERLMQAMANFHDLHMAHKEKASE